MSKTFEDLRAFQRALDLMVDVYTVTNNFPKSELYGLTAHLRQAAGTLIGSIAAQRLSDARGSLCELQAHTIAAHKLGFLCCVAGCCVAGCLRSCVEWRLHAASARPSSRVDAPLHRAIS